MNFFAQYSMLKIAISATETALEPPAVQTRMPFSLQASMSTMSYPAPWRDMIFSFGAASMILRVIFAVRTIIASQSAISAIISSSVNPLPSLTSNPCSLRYAYPSGKIGWVSMSQTMYCTVQDGRFYTIVVVNTGGGPDEAILAKLLG